MKYRIPLSLLALAFSLALSACGLNANAAHPSPTPDPQKAMLAFTQCMRAHGVNMSDPGSGNGSSGDVVTLGGPGNPIDQTTMQAAQDACKSKLPKGGHQPTAAEQQQMQDAALKFTACMRRHGIDMPDPTFGSGGNGAMVQQQLGAGADPTSPQFQAAQKACQSYLPNRGQGLSTSSGGSGFGVTNGGH